MYLTVLLGLMLVSRVSCASYAWTNRRQGWRRCMDPAKPLLLLNNHPSSHLWRSRWLQRCTAFHLSRAHTAGTPQASAPCWTHPDSCLCCTHPANARARSRSPECMLSCSNGRLNSKNH